MNEFVPTFTFKEFALTDCHCGMKIGTDGVLLGAWARLHRPDGLVADIGAGCGVVALMLAARYPNATVTGIELDPGAYADFRTNLCHFPIEAKVEPLQGDYRSLNGSYSLIVSNPPFFTNGALSPSEARATARHAADLSPLVLPAFAASRLEPGGSLAMISPVELTDDIELEAELNRLSVVRSTIVSTSPRRGATRILWELKRREDASGPPERSTLTIGDEEYVRLTRRFYLHY